MTTRFRVGTYINDGGSERWQIERYYPEQEPARWILYSQNIESRLDAMKKIKIHRAKESHDPEWEEV